MEVLDDARPVLLAVRGPALLLTAELDASGDAVELLAVVAATVPLLSVGVTTGALVLDAVGAAELDAIGAPVLDTGGAPVLDTAGGLALDTGGGVVLDTGGGLALDTAGGVVLDTGGGLALDVVSEAVLDCAAPTPPVELTIGVEPNIRSSTVERVRDTSGD